MKFLIKILKSLGWIILVIFILAGIYFLAERVLSRSTVDEVPQNEPKNITIYLMSNGVHTDFVLPVETSWTNWSKVFPYENTLGNQTNFNYVGIGWGDKGFYLDTPEWADLKVSTAIKAATGTSTTALHVTYYREIEED